MKVTVEVDSARFWWLFSKVNAIRATVNGASTYDVDCQDPGLSVKHGETILTMRKCDHNWEILRNGDPIALLDFRYGTLAPDMYDLVWNHTVYACHWGGARYSTSPQLIKSAVIKWGVRGEFDMLDDIDFGSSGECVLKLT